MVSQSERSRCVCIDNMFAVMKQSLLEIDSQSSHYLDSKVVRLTVSMTANSVDLCSETPPVVSASIPDSRLT